MSFDCWFECIRGCGRRYSIYDTVYRCEDCGGLLDVQHDLEALRGLKPEAWLNLFDRRVRTNEWPYGSGVWGKKEWVCPQLDPANIVSMYEGHTNCFWAERLGHEIGLPDLWIKMCGNSHTGSFKDLGMTVLVSVVRQMIADGKEIRAIACASTGDTSAALAAYAAAAGLPVAILLPRGKVSTAQLMQPIANGALVLELDTDFDGCMQVVQQLAEDPTIYLANSMNPLRLEGQKTVGIEIVQQFDWEVPDWIVLPVGNLGNVSALGKGLQMMKALGIIEKLPRIACAQTEKANPFYLSYQSSFVDYRPVDAQKTLASAIQIGDPVSFERAVVELESFEGSIVEQVSEDELANAASQADRSGMYSCPHTGVALAALRKLIERGQVETSDRVVVLSTASGLKFTDFKIGYHNGHLDDVSAQFTNPSKEIAANIEVVNRTINEALLVN